MAFILANPALVDLVQRHWIEVMQFFASVPHGGDEIRRFEQHQMPGDCLSRQGEVSVQLGQGLSVAVVQLIEQFSTAFVSQSLEHGIHLRSIYATKWLHVKCGIEWSVNRMLVIAVASE